MYRNVKKVNWSGVKKYKIIDTMNLCEEDICNYCHEKVGYPLVRNKDFEQLEKLLTDNDLGLKEWFDKHQNINDPGLKKWFNKHQNINGSVPLDKSIM